MVVPVSKFVENLFAVTIVFAFVLIVYAQIRKKSFREVFAEITSLVKKKDGK